MNIVDFLLGRATYDVEPLIVEISRLTYINNRLASVTKPFYVVAPESQINEITQGGTATATELKLHRGVMAFAVSAPCSSVLGLTIGEMS